MTLSDRSYSQYGQDNNVVEFYRGAPCGYFVDIGAFDGINISNTYKLETELEWNGICIEPQEDVFERLKAARQAICINAAVSSESGASLEFSKGKGGNSVLSGITRFLDGWGKKAAMRGHQTVVTSSTLTDILEQNNSPPLIHYMSLDTEGSELEILHGIDFDKYTFGYICVEHNHAEPRRTEMRELLEQNGYFFLKENQCDDDFFHKSMVGGTYYYKKEFSKPIQVELLEDNLVKASSSYWPDQYGLFHPTRLEIEFDNFGLRKVSACSIERTRSDSWHKHPRALNGSD